MGSSRLPGKVLADIGERTALDRLVDRLRRAVTLDDIVLATSTNPADDALEAWATARNLPVHRGSEDDVLGRVVGAHRQMKAELVVEVTGDCPLIDPEVIDVGVETFLANDADVVCNVVRPSFPMGVDVQVFRRGILEEVERTVDDPAVREHVTLHFYEHPERYRIIHLIAPARYRAPARRFQLDYPEDLQFIREVYRRLEPRYGDRFGTPEILALIAADPHLAAINNGCEEKPPR